MREKTGPTHTRAAQQLFYSALPQIVFRDLLPDEEVVRAVEQRYQADTACSWALVASVTVMKDDTNQPLAELRLLGWALPIQASGATASAAVHRAFDQLQVQARVMLGSEAGRQVDQPGSAMTRAGRNLNAERSSNGECSSTQ